MRRRGLAGRAGVLTLSLVWLVAQPLAAQRLVRLSRGAGELGFELSGDQWASSSAATAGASFVAMRQWVRIPISGALLPRPFTVVYGLMLRPQYDQQRSSHAPSSFLNRHTAFDGSLTAFQSAPVSVTAYLNRTTGVQRGGIGAESEFLTRSGGTTVRYQNSYLPVVLQHNVRSATNAWQGDMRTPVFPRDDRLRSVLVSAQSSKTSVALTQVDFDDHVGATSFGSLEGTLQHTLRWGKGSQLATAIESVDRSGRDAQRRQRWSESVQLRHTRSLTTSAQVSRHSSVIRGASISGSAWSLAERWNPRPGVHASIEGEQQSNRYAPGFSRTTRIRPRLALARELRGVNLALTMEGHHERSRRSIGSNAWVDVASERYTVDIARSFRLSEPHADSETLRITSADGTIEFTDGIDYRVTTEGDFLRIHILPGGRVAVGDVMLATYRVRTLERESYGVLGRSLRLSASSRAIVVQHTESARDISAVDGAQAPGDRGGRERNTTLTAWREIHAVRVSADLEHRDRLRSAADFATTEARVTVVSASDRPWQSSVATAAARTMHSGRRAEVLSATGTVTIGFSQSVRTQAALDAWTLRVSDARPEALLGGTIEVDWRFGMVETQWRVFHQDRHAVQNAVQRRFSVRVLRRF